MADDQIKAERGAKPSRVTIYPREAAALDRLLDAYLAEDQLGGHDQDPGYDDLAALRARVRNLPHDHGAYEADAAARVMPRRQWSVEAEDGTTCYTSKDVAQAVASGDHGYAVGSTRSRLVAAFTRPSENAEWERLLPPDSQGGA